MTLQMPTSRTMSSRLRALLRRVLLVAGLLYITTGAVAESAPGVGRLMLNEGWVDIDLPIVEIAQVSDGTRIIARGEIDGTLVGFEVDFASSSKRATGGLPISWGKAQIRSVGLPSDAFVALLAAHYKLPLRAATMVPSVDATVAGLQGDPAHLLDQVTKMKFFFYDSGPQERYAEVFINVDAKNRTLEFHEKDPGYRKPLLQAFKESAPPLRS